MSSLDQRALPKPSSVIDMNVLNTASDNKGCGKLLTGLIGSALLAGAFCSSVSMAQSSPVMDAMAAIYESVPDSTPVAVTQDNNTKVISVGQQSNGTEVSMRGSEGPRMVSGVAAGTRDTDAVNLGQTKAMFNDVNDKIRRTERKADQGTAAAIAAANLPQAVLPGEKVVGVGGGTWSGESGYAVGVSAATDSGKWLINGSVIGSSGGDVGGGVGVGYRWR